MGAIVRILPTLPERRVFEEELPVETTEQEPFAIEKEGGLLYRDRSGDGAAY